jgi:hypothetical protein
LDRLSRSGGRGIGHRMVFVPFTSKFKSVSKTASDNIQMVNDLISLRNKTETIRGWPQLTR